MRKPVEDELQHVLVSQRVKQVLAFAAAAHDVVGSQHAQALRDRRNRLRFQLGQLTDTCRSLHQPRDDSKSCRVAQCAEDASAALQRAIGNLK